MIILDGFEISYEQFGNINPNSVEFVKILTGNAAVSLYGEKGSNGVVIISSNNKRTDCPKAAQCPDKKDCPKAAQCPDKTKEATVTGFITVRANDIKNETIDKSDLKVATQHLKNKPMIILDGFEISYEQFGNINPNSVEFVKILTGNAAVSLYGEKGSNGVVIVSSNNKRTDCPKVAQCPDKTKEATVTGFITVRANDLQQIKDIPSAVQNIYPTVNRLQRPISAINSKVAPIIKKFKQDGNQVSFRLIIPKTDNSKKQQIDIVYQLEN